MRYTTTALAAVLASLAVPAATAQTVKETLEVTARRSRPSAASWFPARSR